MGGALKEADIMYLHKIQLEKPFQQQRLGNSLSWEVAYDGKELTFSHRSGRTYSVKRKAPVFIGVDISGGRPRVFPIKKPRDPRRAWRWIAVSGPLANLLMAFFWGLVIVSAIYVPENFQSPLVQMAGYGILINAVLFALNLIPILPWDGGIIIDTFLPAKQSMQFRKIEPYGTWIILILLFTGLLGKLIMPMVAAVQIAVQALMTLFV